MSEYFLSKDELVRMTGYAQPARQVRWLRENLIEHTISARGEASVTRTAIENRHTSTPKKKQSKINWDALNA